MGRRTAWVVAALVLVPVACTACGGSSTGAGGAQATMQTAPSTTTPSNGVPTTTVPPSSTAASTTTTGAADYSGLVGEWGAHGTGGLTIASDGTGTVKIPDFLACPTCDGAGVPQNAIAFALHTVYGGTATGTVVASTDPNGQDGNGTTVAGLYAVGLPVTVGPGSTATGRALVVSVNGTRLDQFCDQPAQLAGTCGA